jgi:hypothetical protein
MLLSLRQHLANVIQFTAYLSGSTADLLQLFFVRLMDLRDLPTRRIALSLGRAELSSQLLIRLFEPPRSAIASRLDRGLVRF